MKNEIVLGSNNLFQERNQYFDLGEVNMMSLCICFVINNYFIHTKYLFGKNPVYNGLIRLHL